MYVIYIIHIIYIYYMSMNSSSIRKSALCIKCRVRYVWFDVIASLFLHMTRSFTQTTVLVLP